MIAEAIPGAELLILDGMGHDFPRELIPRIVKAIVENSNNNQQPLTKVGSLPHRLGIKLEITISSSLKVAYIH